MTQYLCWDGQSKCEIEADSPGEAAEEFASAFEPANKTYWVSVRVTEIDDDGEYNDDDSEHKISIDPDPPPCEDDHKHRWGAPYSVLGGIKENPGVWGKGGGIISREICRYCGKYRVTDTWAQDPEDGAQGLTSVEYEDSDELSEAYVRRGG